MRISLIAIFLILSSSSDSMNLLTAAIARVSEKWSSRIEIKEENRTSIAAFVNDSIASFAYLLYFFIFVSRHRLLKYRLWFLFVFLVDFYPPFFDKDTGDSSGRCSGFSKLKSKLIKNVRRRFSANSTSSNRYFIWYLRLRSHIILLIYQWICLVKHALNILRAGNRMVPKQGNTKKPVWDQIGMFNCNRVTVLAKQ